MQQEQDQDALFEFEQGFSINDAQFNILPEQIICNLKGKHQQQFKLSEQVQTLPEVWQQIAKDIQEQIRKILFAWKVEKKNKICSFYFNLPPSYFKQKITIFEKLNDDMLREYNEVQKLTPDQLEQIKQSGTFDVPSKKFPIPYVWQISSVIIKGVKHIEQTYNKALSLAYSVYYTLPQLLKGEQDHLNGFHLTIASGLNNILTKPLVIIGIIIGFREMSENENKVKLYYEVEVERQLRLKQLNIQSILYECFNFKNSNEELQARQIKEQMNEFAQKFNDKARLIKVYLQNVAELTEMKLENKRLTVEDSERIELISNLTQEIENLSAEIEDFYKTNIDVNQSIEKQIQNHLMKCQEIYWQKSKYEPLLIEQLINLTKCEQTLEYYTNVRDNELKRQTDIFIDNLKIRHPIKSLCYKYLNDEVKNFKKQIKKTLNLEMRQSIVKELQENNVKEVEIYLDYYQHCKQEKEIIKQKIDNKEHITLYPLREIICRRQCFPPYKVIYMNDSYQLERIKYYRFNTSFYGWRLYLMGLTWYTWTMNVMFWLFVNAISAKFGLRALFSVRTFHPDVYIDPNTGRVSHSQFSVTPVTKLFQQVIEGMKKSRRRFEEQPDTGFFGKNFQRLWNYFEVYIFRFLFVGILLVCILLPIVILFNSIISLILAVTAFAWIPIVILHSFLFKILIFDWDVNYPRDKLIRHYQFFPLFTNVYAFLINGVFQFILSLFMIAVISPICLLMISLYAILQKYTRLYYDLLMLQMVKLLGRVPATENNLAWKIAGPRISRKHFYGISLDQAIILIAAQLEIVILRTYQIQMEEQIRAPSKHIQGSLEKFFSLFSANIRFVDEGVDILIEQLAKQIAEQSKLLPKLEVQVRFTEDELVVLLKEAKKFVKKQILLKKMGDYIWRAYQIRVGDYNSLVEAIVMSVFGKNILEPLEDIDMRFSLKEEDTHDLKQKITRALKGQINLELPEKYIIQELGTDQITVQKKFENFSRVIDQAYHYQRSKQNWSCIIDKKSRFYKNACLK